jgi:hypothetical protein
LVIDAGSAETIAIQIELCVTGSVRLVVVIVVIVVVIVVIVVIVELTETLAAMLSCERRRLVLLPIASHRVRLLDR